MSPFSSIYPPSLSLSQNVHVISMSHGQVLPVISCTGIRHGHWCWPSLCPQCCHSSTSLAYPSKLCHGHCCLWSVFFILLFIPLLTIPLNTHTSIHMIQLTIQVLPLVASSSQSCSIAYSRALLASSGEYALLPSLSSACCYSPTCL